MAPNLQTRPLGIAGLGDLLALKHSLGDAWQDGDRTRVTGAGEIRTVPGYNRRTMAPIFDAALHGAASNRLAVMAFSERVHRKQNGHGLAVVDASANSLRRILSLIHMDGGELGTVLVGIPKLTTGSGLDDLSTRGPYTGTSPIIVEIEIDSALGGTGGVDTFKWSIDGGDTYEAEDVDITGDWQPTGDGIEGVQIKFDATTGHTLGNIWTFTLGGRPMLMAEMERQEPHTYPAMVGHRGRVVVMHSRSVPLVDNGLTVNEAGIRAPHIKPIALVAGGFGADIGDTDSDATNWVGLGGSLVAFVDSGFTVPDGDGFVGVQPPLGNSEAVDVAYLDTSGTLATTAKRVRLWFAFTGTAPSVKGQYSLVFSDTAGLAGTGSGRLELEFPDAYPGSKWTEIDLPLDLSSSFAFLSIGIRLNKPTADPARFGIDRIRVFDESVIPASTLFEGPGKWRFAASWVNRGKDGGSESALSPFTDEIELDGQGVEIDVSGIYPGIDTGLANKAPEGVDAVHLYAFRDDFGVDGRLAQTDPSGATRGPGAFYRLTPPRGISIAALQTDYTAVVAYDGDNDGDGVADQVLLTGFDIPDQVFTLTATSAGPGARFSLVGATSGTILDGSADSAIVSGGVTLSPGGFLQVRVTDGSSAWAIDDSITITTTKITRTDGKLIAKLGTPMSMSALQGQPLPAFYNRPVEPAEAAAVDGDLVVCGGQKPYSVGEFTFAANSHVITPKAGSGTTDTPVVGAWMEGRELVREGTADIYRIVKALDTDSDGVPDKLWIAKTFDPIKQAFVDPYDGPAGDFRVFIKGEARDVWWTNKTEAQGVDVENASVLNRLTVMPSGDSVIALAKAGEYLMVLGRFNIFILRQDTAALADNPTAGGAYSAPTHIPNVGIMGKRCWASTQGGGGVFLTPAGELMAVTAGAQIERHPASERLHSILTGWGFLTDTRGLDNCFLEYVNTGAEEMIYIGLIGGGQSVSAGAGSRGEPGVTSLATDHYRDRETVAGGGEDTVDEGTMLTWPDTGDVPGEDAANDEDQNLATNENELFAFNPSVSGQSDPWAVPDPNSDSIVSANGTTDPQAAETVDVTVSGSPTTETIGNGTSYRKFTIPVAAFDDSSFEVATGTVFNGVVGFQYLHPDATHLIGRIKMVGASGDEMPVGGLNLRLYFEAHDFDNDGDGETASAFIDITNAEAIPANVWKAVRFELVQGGNDWDTANSLELFYQIDNLAGGIVLSVTATGSAAVFTGSGGNIELHMANFRMANGPTITESDAASDEPPLDFTGGSYCPEPGAAINVSTLGDDFLIGLLVDLKGGQVWPCSECPFTCAGVRPTDDCTPLVQPPPPAFFGDKNGRIGMMFLDKTLTWGSPADRFVFDADSAAPGSSTTFKIERDFGGQPDQLALALDDDSVGVLGELVCAKVPAKVTSEIEFRRISSNTIDTVTVSAAWTVNPVAGDKLIVGPLPLLIHWAERRFVKPAASRALAGFYEQASVAGWNGQRLDPRFRIEVFTGGARGTVKTATAAVSRWFGEAEWLRGRAAVRVEGRAGRALAYRLLGIQGDDAPIVLRDLLVEERTQ